MQFASPLIKSPLIKSPLIKSPPSRSPQSKFPRRLGLVAVALLAATSSATGDTTKPGFELTRMPSPVSWSITCSLPGGDFVVFDGEYCDRYAPDGTALGSLGSLPLFGFPSFAEPSPDGLSVIVGESGTVFHPPEGRLWRVPLDGSGPTLIASVPQNYDGAFLPDGRMIVTAALQGTGFGNDLVLVDVANGTATAIGHVDGYSGPVAVARNGDVYYGTVIGQIPAPPGSTDIVRWSVGLVLSGAWLDASNATLVAGGFDGASSLAFDPLRGRLYLAENTGNGFHRIRRVKTSAASSPILADGDHWISSIRFQDLGGDATFDPYQPGDGLSIVYETSDFSTMFDLVTLSPKQPVLSASGPGLSGVGAIQLDITGAVPNGSALLTYCPQGQLLPSQVYYTLPRFRLHTTFTLPHTSRAPFAIPVDASGNGSMQIWNSGSLLGMFGYQLHVGLANGSLIGATNVLQF